MCPTTPNSPPCFVYSMPHQVPHPVHCPTGPNALQFLFSYHTRYPIMFLCPTTTNALLLMCRVPSNTLPSSVSYCSKCHIIFLVVSVSWVFFQVFDVQRKITYKNLTSWYKELREYRPEIPCCVVANKIDGGLAVL